MRLKFLSGVLTLLSFIFLPAQFAQAATCNGLTATIVAVTGQTNITGTNGADVIVAYDDNNYIDSRKGHDTICVGNGNTTIITRDGNDSIFAGNGNNTIDTGKGDDYVIVGNGNNNINTGDGKDVLITGNGNNIVDLGGHADRATLGSGNDHVFAGDGADIVILGEGINWVDLSDGADVVTGGTNSDVIIGGKGQDWIDAGEGANTVSADAGADTVFTGFGNDYIQLGEGADVLVDLGGDNIIFGFTGPDSITTGDGNDSIDGGDGDDIIYAGEGNNTIFAGNGADIVRTGTGNDYVNLGRGNDNIIDTGGNNYIDGERENDTIVTADGDDVIFGGNGDDNIVSGAGNDTIDTNGGFDTINAGLGLDICIDFFQAILFDCEITPGIGNNGSSDTTAPTVFVSQPPSYINEVNVPINIEWSDFHSGVDPSTFTILVNLVDRTADFTFTPFNASASIAVTGETVLAFDIHVADYHGNAVDSNWATRVDLTPPVFNSLSPIGALPLNVTDVSIEASFSDNLCLDSDNIEFIVDGAHKFAYGSSATFQPIGGWSDGLHTWSVSIIDCAGNSATTGLLLFSVNTNVAPQAFSAGPFQIFSGETITGVAPAFDENLDLLVFELVNVVTEGTAYIDSLSGAYSFTAATDFVGSVNLEFRVFDGLLYSNTATITIDVASDANLAPEAVSASLFTFSNQALTDYLQGTDPNDDPLSFELVSAPTNGIVEINTLTGEFVYQPVSTFTGKDSFSFRVSDGEFYSSPASVIVDVIPNIIPASGFSAPKMEFFSYIEIYRTNYTPFSYNGVLYNDLMLIPFFPLNVFELGFFAIREDNTPVPAEGEVNINVYLMDATTSTARFTLFSPLPETFITLIFSGSESGLHVAKTLDSFFIANGFGYDYSINQGLPPDTYIVTGPTNGSAAAEVSFEFAASELASFQCRIDRITWVDCASPFLGAVEYPGIHLFEVRAIDLNGDIDPYPAQMTWASEVTAIPPDTYFISGPDLYVTTNSATFTFGADEPNATFECALQGQPFFDCASPQTISGLAPGLHIFTVRAVSSAGIVDPSPATHAWIIIDDRPVAFSAVFGAIEDRDLTRQLSASDPENDPLEYVVVNSPLYGTLDLNFDGAFIYRAMAGSAGLHDQFTFRVTDGSNFSNIATAQISITTVTTPQINFTNVLPSDLLNDEFNDDKIADQWIPFSFPLSVTNSSNFYVTQYTEQYLFETDGFLTFDAGEIDPYLNPGDGRSFFIVSRDLYAPQSFTVATQIEFLENDFGPHVYGMAMFDINDPEETVLLLQAFADETTQVIISFTLARGTPFPVSLPLAGIVNHGPGTKISVAIEYDHIAKTLVATLPTASPSLIRYIDVEFEHPVGLVLVGASGKSIFGGSTPPTTTHTHIGFDYFRSSLTAATEGFVATVSPFELNGLDYSQGLAHEVSPAIIYLAGFIARPISVRPIEVAEDETRVQADGLSNIHVALVTFEDGRRSTLYTGLTQPNLTAYLAGVESIDAFYENYFIANGVQRSYSHNQGIEVPDTIITNSPPYFSFVSEMTFTYADSGTYPAVSFECMHSKSPNFESCYSLSSTTITNYTADGKYFFRVRGVAANGDVDPTPAIHEWYIDTSAPTDQFVFITTPDALSLDASPVFEFEYFGITRESEAPIVFYCSLDDTPYSVCASPLELSALALGDHNLKVSVRDAAGNVAPTIHEYPWFITREPHTTLLSTPDQVTLTHYASFVFSADLPATFECIFDYTSYGLCESPFFVTDLVSGYHSLTILATGELGHVDANPPTFDWYVADLTPPETFITAYPVGINFGWVPPLLESQTAFPFEFTASQPSDFYCSIDYSGFTLCSNPVSYTDLSQGVHRFTVYAYNNSTFVADPFPVNFDFEVDISPTTTILSGPELSNSVTIATFTFAANEPSTFLCQLDQGAAFGCASPLTITGLTFAEHTLYVRAVDARGHIEDPAVTYTWSVLDIFPPTTIILSGPERYSKESISTFEFFTDDTLATSECSLDEAAFSPCVSPLNYTLAEGNYSLVIRSRDLAGNVETNPPRWLWTIMNDTTSDTVIVSGPPSNTLDPEATFVFEAVPDEPGIVFECSFDDGPWLPCSNPKTYYGVVTGEHTLEVVNVDPSGNRDATPATWTWGFIDLIPPTTRIMIAPKAIDKEINPRFIFKTSEPADLTCKLDGGSTFACNLVLELANLNNGAHYLEVFATDRAGNIETSVQSYSWVIDSTPPDTTLDIAPLEAVDPEITELEFEFSSADGLRYECRFNKRVWRPCESPFLATEVEPGLHTFFVRAIDEAGNVDPEPEVWIGKKTFPIPAPIVYSHTGDADDVFFAEPGHPLGVVFPSSNIGLIQGQNISIGSVVFFDKNSTIPLLSENPDLFFKASLQIVMPDGVITGPTEIVTPLNAGSCATPGIDPVPSDPGCGWTFQTYYFEFELPVPDKSGIAEWTVAFEAVSGTTVIHQGWTTGETLIDVDDPTIKQIEPYEYFASIESGETLNINVVFADASTSLVLPGFSAILNKGLEDEIDITSYFSVSDNQAQLSAVPPGISFGVNEVYIQTLDSYGYSKITRVPFFVSVPVTLEEGYLRSEGYWLLDFEQKEFDYSESNSNIARISIELAEIDTSIQEILFQVSPQAPLFVLPNDRATAQKIAPHLSHAFDVFLVEPIPSGHFISVTSVVSGYVTGSNDLDLDEKRLEIVTIVWNHPTDGYLVLTEEEFMNYEIKKRVLENDYVHNPSKILDTYPVDISVDPIEGGLWPNSNGDSLIGFSMADYITDLDMGNTEFWESVHLSSPPQSENIAQYLKSFHGFDVGGRDIAEDGLVGQDPDYLWSATIQRIEIEGSNKGTAVPVVGARVYLMDEDDGEDDVLCTGKTNSQGKIVNAPCTASSDKNSNPDLYIKVLASDDYIRIGNTSTPDLHSTYAIKSPTKKNAPAGHYSAFIQVNSALPAKYPKIFHIFNWSSRTYHSTMAYSTKAKKSVEIEFPNNRPKEMSWYRPFAEMIAIKNSEYWYSAAVVAHETGHRLMHIIQGSYKMDVADDDLWNGGFHSKTCKDKLDDRNAFGEGMAEFLSLAHVIQGSSSSTQPCIAMPGASAQPGGGHSKCIYFENIYNYGGEYCGSETPATLQSLNYVKQLEKPVIAVLWDLLDAFSDKHSSWEDQMKGNFPAFVRAVERGPDNIQKFLQFFVGEKPVSCNNINQFKKTIGLNGFKEDYVNLPNCTTPSNPPPSSSGGSSTSGGGCSLGNNSADANDGGWFAILAMLVLFSRVRFYKTRKRSNSSIACCATVLLVGCAESHPLEPGFYNLEKYTGDGICAASDGVTMTVELIHIEGDSLNSPYKSELHIIDDRKIQLCGFVNCMTPGRDGCSLDYGTYSYCEFSRPLTEPTVPLLFNLSRLDGNVIEEVPYESTQQTNPSIVILCEKGQWQFKTKKIGN